MDLKAFKKGVQRMAESTSGIINEIQTFEINIYCRYDILPLIYSKPRLLTTSLSSIRIEDTKNGEVVVGAKIVV